MLLVFNPRMESMENFTTEAFGGEQDTDEEDDEEDDEDEVEDWVLGLAEPG